MTAQLTRERIEQYANDPRMCNVNEEIRTMARMLLSGMDSVPFGFVRNVDNFSVMSISKTPMCDVGVDKPLYAAPPAPVAVPDNVFNDAWEQHLAGVMCGDNNKQAALSFLNACRAAVLKSGTVTADTVPDGWKLVPVEPTEAMLDAAYSHPASTEDRMRKQYASMLAASPAAPEQEV